MGHDSSLDGWTHFELFTESASSPKYIARPFCERQRHQSSSCNTPFYSRISSQLLTYRIIVTFGMPPRANGSMDNNCWEIVLHYRGGSSTLRFWDYGGSARVQFQGCEEGRNDALELVNYLTGLDCWYHCGMQAGTEAFEPADSVAEYSHHPKSKAMDEMSKVTPSLETLSSKACRKQLLNAKFRPSDFASLESRLIELVFIRMRKEINRLQTMEKE
ncbi:hypothetical protein M501DRAFT_1012718 [Patellaria atrata CBS 101060]|uniref:Uncharacterized protein n=1 Tax=Patellaria atrata CBS 101060 TaxID=1346257 RepID=A0A9P4SKP5_9PEZI|nr:hypothetical protein M501DRAFT_1012718 [Patellaria atrata CBS 101060]